MTGYRVAHRRVKTGLRKRKIQHRESWEIVNWAVTGYERLIFQHLPKRPASRCREIGMWLDRYFYTQMTGDEESMMKARERVKQAVNGIPKGSGETGQPEQMTMFQDGAA